VRQFPESRLRLLVNQQKSAPAFAGAGLPPAGERKFRGYRLDGEGDLGIGPKSLARQGSPASDYQRYRAISLEQMIGEANSFPDGSRISAMPARTSGW